MAPASEAARSVFLTPARYAWRQAETGAFCRIHPRNVLRDILDAGWRFSHTLKGTLPCVMSWKQVDSRPPRQIGVHSASAGALQRWADAGWLTRVSFFEE